MFLFEGNFFWKKVEDSDLCILILNGKEIVHLIKKNREYTCILAYSFWFEF